MKIITKTSHQAKSSKQCDADEVEINNTDADRRSPRHDKVMNSIRNYVKRFISNECKGRDLQIA
jgi:hypothetical protein